MQELVGYKYSRMSHGLFKFKLLFVKTIYVCMNKRDSWQVY